MNYIKETFQDNPIISSIVAIVASGLIFILIDGLFTNKEPFSGIIVDKFYKSESTSVGTGIVNTSNGSGVITTIETDPEKFLIMVKVKEGEIFTVQCKSTLYYEKKIGSKIFCHHQIGFFTNSIWSSYGDF